MLDEFDRLEAEANAQRRGRGLERLVGHVFANADFEVEHNAGAARPRQTDLFAMDGAQHYLIEAKWTRHPVDVGAIASLRDRLRRTPASTVGVLMSMAGFTSTALNEAEIHRGRPILLFDGDEVRRLVHGQSRLRSALAEKRAALLVDGRVLVGGARSPRERQRALRGRASLARGRAEIAEVDGARVEWWRAAGEYEPYAFVRSLPDVDWVPAGGNGVTVDIRFEPGDQKTLVGMLEGLAADGWFTHEGWWNIRQSTANWHGLGGATLLKALAGWKDRYQRIEATHHTEEVVYAGPCDGGLIRWMFDVSADDRRMVWHADVALQLIGVPLNLNPLRRLAETIGCDMPVYLRPLSESAVSTLRVPPPRTRLEQVARLVETDDSGTEWVTGIIARNPAWGARDPSARDDRLESWPEALIDTEVLVCDLRHHYPSDEPPPEYELWSVEHTWLSDTLIARVVADWPRR